MKLFFLKTSLVVALLAGSALQAANKKVSLFKPMFGQKLYHLKSQPAGCLKGLALRPSHRKREVYINWQRIHGGDYNKFLAALDGSRAGEEPAHQTDDELATALREFAREFGYRVVWNKEADGITDLTQDFLEYWDNQDTPGLIAHSPVSFLKQGETS